MFYKEIFKFERIGSKNFIKLDINKEESVINYQIKMINENIIKGILPIDLIIFNNIDTLCYDITSKIPLERYLSICKDREKILNIIVSICEIINNSNKYYLNENQFLIDKDFIFISPEPSEVFLIYLPFNTQLNSINSLIDICIELNNYDNLKSDMLYKELLSKKELNYLDVINIINRILKVETGNNSNNEKELNYNDYNYSEKEERDTSFFTNLIHKLFHKKIKNSSNKNFFKNIKTIDDIECKSREKNLEEAYFQVSECEGEKKYEKTTLLNNKVAFLENDKCKHTINKDNFVVGRLESTNLCIEDKSIGRIHCEIIKKNNDYYVIDYNSKNGTILNGKRIICGIEYLLNNNDTLCFAETNYIFKLF